MDSHMMLSVHRFQVTAMTLTSGKGNCPAVLCEHHQELKNQDADFVAGLS